MIAAPYSLLQVRTDGDLTAPRYLHHLVKVATHTSVAFALACVGVPMLHAAVIAGPAFWLLLALHERFWPSDIQPLTLWQHVADWMNDCALATIPVVGALLAGHDWIGAALLFVACYGAWLAGHKDARP